MLDRHAVQELRRAGVTARAIATQYGISVRTVRRLGREAAVEDGVDATARHARGVGRPGVSDAMRARVRALVVDDPARPPGEIVRLLHAEETPLGLSTAYRMLAAVRATLPTPMSVRSTPMSDESAQVAAHWTWTTDHVACCARACAHSTDRITGYGTRSAPPSATSGNDGRWRRRDSGGARHSGCHGFPARHRSVTDV